MPSEDFNPNQFSKNKQLNREIREMVSAITGRLTGGLHKPGSGSHRLVDGEEEHSMEIVMLAGTNNGATLRREAEKKFGDWDDHIVGAEGFCTKVNSNFQGINNSVVLCGSCEANDPGVHIDVSDVTEEYEKEKYGKKRQRKQKEGYESERHSTHSD